MEKQTQFNLWYLMIAILGVLWLRDAWMTMTQVEPISYSEFQHHLKEGKIKEITIGSTTIQGVYKQPLPDGRSRFVTTPVNPELARDL